VLALAFHVICGSSCLRGRHIRPAMVWDHAGRVAPCKGNIGGALSPLVFGVLAQLGSWAAPFIVTAGLLVVGSVVWAFWLDPDASVVEQYRLPTTADVAVG
jgi:hypothetical protein